MKIKEKMKKIGIIICTPLVAIHTKVSALHMSYLYGPPEVIEPEKEAFFNAADIMKMITIPIVLVIGIGVYLVKSKSSWKKKILISLGIIVLATIIYGVVWFVVNGELNVLKK